MSFVVCFQEWSRDLRNEDRTPEQQLEDAWNISLMNLIQDLEEKHLDTPEIIQTIKDNFSAQYKKELMGLGKD